MIYFFVIGVKVISGLVNFCLVKFLKSLHNRGWAMISKSNLPHSLKTAFEELKFIYFEKATNFCEMSSADLSYVVTVKSMVEISQNFVALSEYIYEFIRFCPPALVTWQIPCSMFINLFQNSSSLPIYFILWFYNFYTLNDVTTFAPPPCLFPPPRLLEEGW